MVRISLIGIVAGCLLTCGAVAESAWVTVFVKRGFVGNYHAKWAGGMDVTLRKPVPIMTDGERVRVWVESSRTTSSSLKKLTLAKGANRTGEIVPPSNPVTFQGQPALEIPEKMASVCSDEVPMPITPGIWYLQESYDSTSYLYAYDSDGYWSISGVDSHDHVGAGTHRSAYPGNVIRIDVLSREAPPVILCYGDSITQGASSTPNGGKRYPERLAALLQQPVLNYGMNGDQVRHSRGAPKMITKLDGVREVIFLMGVNDLMTGTLEGLAAYEKAVRAVIGPLTEQGVRVYLGTITPGTGFERYDRRPETELLRQEINAWIRTVPNGVAAVIDFDAALRDPEAPAKLRADFQADWLHPNDAGYEAMAACAAEVIKANRAVAGNMK